jgi:ribosomal protein L7/L12
MASDQDDIAELKRQVQRHSELIDALYRRLGVGPLDAAGIPTTDSVPPEIAEAIRAGNTIVAIKLWRARTGLGLAEAKAQVEEYARTLA